MYSKILYNIWNDIQAFAQYLHHKKEKKIIATDKETFFWKLYLKSYLNQAPGVHLDLPTFGLKDIKTCLFVTPTSLRQI